ncbi:MAG: aminomethyl transferase family protein [Myxococcales bacterium]|nr:MAG: aminomethyl transferase family protein [Myxococcales bacterium]
MTLNDEIQAIRYRVAFSRMDYVSVLRLVGEDAYDLTEALCSSDLYLRDSQMRHTLWLDESGQPAADLYACLDDEDVLLLVEGMDGAQAAEYVRRFGPAEFKVEIRDLTESHELLSLDGPYAWEMMAEIAGPGVIGMPFLTFYNDEAWTCFRAGKTGEFGYHLLVAKENAGRLQSRLLEMGGRFDMQTVSLPALDLCALENWFFSIRHEGRSGANPIELQLQWRLTRRKSFPGSEALDAARAKAERRRLTCALADADAKPGDGVWLAGSRIGEVIRAEPSLLLKRRIVLALIDERLAHPGLEMAVGASAAESGRMLTVSPPLFNNRSLFIQPQKHSYRSRDEFIYPDIVREFP